MPEVVLDALVHYTPTYSSWLNQVEIWFSKIQRDVISRGVFTSVKDLARKLLQVRSRRFPQAHRPVERHKENRLSGAVFRYYVFRNIPSVGGELVLCLRFIEKSDLRCCFQLIRRLDCAYSNTLLSLAVARARRHLLANA
jgi:hypothetical protein